MNRAPLLRRSISWLAAVLAVQAMAVDAARADEKPGEAVVRVRAGKRAAEPIPKYITGKFCEHLGSNIYNGMDAQILRNPTFAEHPFSNGQTTPDGVVAFHGDRQEIARQMRSRAQRFGWPEAELDRLVEASDDALARWWTREGSRHDVQPSPDAGPQGGRAQRVETSGADQGIAQWTYLPLHRVRKYEFEILARSPDLASLTLRLFAGEARQPCGKAAVTGLSGEWQTFRGVIQVDADSPADAVYRVALTAGAAGQFVIGRALLRPADHMGGADPDVVRLLRESRLPLLRWPGGNFVSGYHWEDGIGPLEGRPTRPNYAWGGVEPNLFGTDEFMAFCRAVGCEPMICINAGSGTPEEAARWVEYCNGPADSPMGRLRAANGHPAPYAVRHWEVGNELWGRWQYHWTTASGYVDRYQRFRKAMLAADPTITLYACGAPAMSDRQWNATLIRGVGESLGTITDHPLIGGSVPQTADPMDVYRDFMAVPDVLAAKWADIERQMRAVGIDQPRLAVTELQMFARLGPPGPPGADGGDVPAKLTRENLVSPPTLAEALYDVLIYHRAIRLVPLVTMVTHSATVNHGGGLRKDRERVYANPCHWAHAGFARLAGARPVAVEVTSPHEDAPRVLPGLRNAAPQCRFEAIDALAAVADGGVLWLSIVHRGSSGPVRLAVELEDFAAGPKAEVHTLSAEAPWAANTLEAPEAVRPHDSTAEIRDGKLRLELKPYTWVRLRIPSPSGAAH